MGMREKLIELPGNDAILIGAGNLGMALMSYRGFDNYGINIVAAFDSRPEVIDNKKVFDICDALEEKFQLKSGVVREGVEQFLLRGKENVFDDVEPIARPFELKTAPPFIALLPEISPPFNVIEP